MENNKRIFNINIPVSSIPVQATNSRISVNQFKPVSTVYLDLPNIIK